MSQHRAWRFPKPPEDFARSPDSIQNRGLVGWWPMYHRLNRTAKGTLYDLGPYSKSGVLNGSILGAAAPIASEMGFALDLNNADGHVTVADNALLEPGANPFTVTCWQKYIDAPISNGIIGKWSTTGNNRCWDIATHWVNGDELYVAFGYADGSALYSAGESTDANLVTGVLYHCAFVMVPAGTPQIYLNGRRLTWAWDSGTAADASFANTTAPFDIGRWLNQDQHFYDVRYYNVALTAAEIQHQVDPDTRFDLLWVPRFQMVVGKPPAGGGAQTISPSGIASAEAFGTAVLTPGAVTLAPSGIASAGALGTPALTPGAVTVSPTGIATGEAFGTPALSPGAVTVSPTGIATGEAFGTPALTPGAVTITPTGIASAEALGTPALTPGAVNVSPSGIASGETFGTAFIGVALAPAGIGSAEAFGTPALTPGPVTVSPTGITSAEAFGLAALLPGAVLILPAGVVSAEVWGLPTIALTGAQTIVVVSIASAEVFGVCLVATLVLYADAEHTYVVPVDDFTFVVPADDLDYVVPGDDFIYLARR